MSSPVTTSSCLTIAYSLVTGSAVVVAAAVMAKPTAGCKIRGFRPKQIDGFGGVI